MFDEFDDDIEKNSEDTSAGFWRFWMVMIIILFCFFIVIVRLFIIQVYDSEKFQQRARQQHESKITLSAERGNIYDRHRRLVASTINSISIAVDPKVLIEKNKVCYALQKATGIDSRVFLKDINSSNSSFVWLARSLMPDKSKSLEQMHFSGLLKYREPKRNFLYGSIGSQIIGAANLDNSGISGIEKAYDSILTGSSGFMIMQRDAKRRLRATADLPLIPAVNGKSIILTLDIELQRIVEYELMRGVLKTQAASGTIIAIAPSTGEILAMASYPTYNPNNLSNRLPGGMKNKAITDVYEPGSTFKLITAAAAIEEGIISPETIVNGYNGELNFGVYRIKDDHPVGIVTFKKAFEQSSNVVFSQVGDSIPKVKFYKYVRDFGFGNTLGIDLIGEVPGKVRKPKYYNASTKRFLSHGYGIAVTALQLTCSYATVANNGILMRPFVVKSIINNDGSILLEKEPQKIRRVISEKTCEILNEMLVGVVEKGTGRKAKINNFSIAGKTGTTQQWVDGTYSKKHYTGSFAGFFPAEDPKIAMIVIIDKPKGVYYGGSTAAPIFHNIVASWISINSNFLGLNSGEIESSDSVTVPYLKGFNLSDAISILEKIDLPINTLDSKEGIVVHQSPSGGSKVSNSTEILIQTLTPDSSSNAIGKIQKPDVRGYSLRKAISILHKARIKIQVKGSGKVNKQIWKTQNDGSIRCTLICK